MVLFGKNITVRTSLRAKLMGALALFILTTIVGLSLFNISSQRQSLIANERTRSLSLATTFAANSAQALLFRDYALLEYFVGVVSDEDDVRYADILDADGKVLVSTDHRFEGTILKDDIGDRATRTKKPLIQEFREEGEDFYDVAVPVEIGDAKWGTVRIGVSLKSTNNAISSVTEIIIVRAIVTCVIGLFLAFLLAQSMTRPISLLAEASQKIAEGDLSQKVNISTRDEVGDLAKVFNAMTESLALSMRNLHKRFTERSILYDFSSSISTSMSVRDILTKLLDTSVQVLDADAGAFLLLDENEGKLKIDLSQGLLPEFVGMIDLKIGEGIAGKVARDAKPAVTDDICEESPKESCQGYLKSSLSVPLIIQGKVSGVLNLYTKETLKFCDEDLETVSLMVDQASVAIEREKLLESLGEEKSKTESILKSMADGVLAINTEGKIIVLNPTVERIFGLPGSEKLNLALVEVIKQPDMIDLMFRSLKEGRELTQEIGLHGTEERIIQIKTSLINGDDAFLGVVAIVRDITEVRRLSQAKSDFISMVSHELRTPLATIKAYTDTLIKKGSNLNDKTVSEFLGIIRSESKRLTKMVGQLLDASTIEAGYFEIELEVVDLLSLIETTIEEMHRLRVNEHRFKLDFPEKVSMLVGDPDKIRQVIANLIENAIKYSPETSTVTISVQEDAEKVAIAVADNGIGIDEEYIERIFQRFYRVHDDMVPGKWGAGLGLFIAKTIINAHGGRIWVESERKKGSKFTFTLPKHRKIVGEENKTPADG